MFVLVYLLYARILGIKMLAKKQLGPSKHAGWPFFWFMLSKLIVR